MMRHTKMHNPTLHSSNKAKASVSAHISADECLPSRFEKIHSSPELTISKTGSKGFLLSNQS